MTDTCYCDYDAPQLYCARMVTAKKPHKCSECSAPIQPGEQYEYVFGKWDGDHGRFKTCARCLDVKKFVAAHVPCFCWAHGNILNDCQETAEEYAHEAPGLWFGTLRRIKRTEPKWRKQ